MAGRTMVLGVEIDKLDAKEFAGRLTDFMKDGQSHQINTVNAEFLVAAQKDKHFREILRTSSLNTADSSGVLWAAKYLSLPLFRFPLLKLTQALWQLVFTGIAIVFWPSFIRTVLPEKISGVDIIWLIGEWAQRRGHKIFLLGGFGGTSGIVAKKLREKFPKLAMAGTYAGSPEERGIVERVNALKPDILLVAFGPVRQEKWIADNLKNLRVKAAIGLGGTFDYIAGEKPLAPVFLRNRGLEWTFRLFTQPYRLFRVFNAVPVFIWYTLRYKLLLQRQFRKCVLACIVNEERKILICRRKPEATPPTIEADDHWQLPQGGVNEGESDDEALKREVDEETGLENVQILGKLSDAYCYDWPLDLAHQLHKGKYRGQSQTIFFVKVDTKLQPVKLDNREFDDHRWVKPEQLICALHPFRKDSARIITDHLKRFVN